MEKKSTDTDTEEPTSAKDGGAKRSSIGSEEISPSKQIDSIIRSSEDWRGKKLSHLRSVIRKANQSIDEEVKWKKPSKPEGVPVWSRDGILCVADILKNAVRLTFPKGAQIRDPLKIFNTRLDSKTVRAVDYHQNDDIDESALTELVREAIDLNALKAHAKGKK